MPAVLTPSSSATSFHTWQAAFWICWLCHELVRSTTYLLLLCRFFFLCGTSSWWTHDMEAMAS